jgi:hypothetical protein
MNDTAEQYVELFIPMLVSCTLRVHSVLHVFLKVARFDFHHASDVLCARSQLRFIASESC